MTNQIEARLTQLQAEYQKGQEHLAALEHEVTKVRDAMLRISGAIQVLEELLAKDEAAQEGPTTPANGRMATKAS
jgi:predicted  nucleic acid-binding Zn-ribbon protein